MKIVHVAAETAPFAKVGGLADVLQGLPLELAREHHNVEIIIPYYKTIKEQKLYPLQVEDDFTCYEKGILCNNRAFSHKFNGIKLNLIDTKQANDYFDRDSIYGYPDDIVRFIYFCRSVLEYLLKRKEEIDILHIHDWHTALIAPLYKDLFSGLGLKIKAIVFTIHNLKYQGLCASWDLDYIGLKGSDYLSNDKLQDNEPQNKNLINLLKGGIVYSDAITTVSPTYAKEILKPQEGYNLDQTLLNYKNKLKGILNGLDFDAWNPKKDRYLESFYAKDDPIETIFKSKKENKKKLYEELGLTLSNKPLVCAITRLVPQKGPALIKQAILETLKNNGQFILLGSSPILEIQEEFINLKELKDNRDVYLHLTYDEKTSHRLYAAADFIIIPSLFEPCGLTQLIGFRFGTIPIARKTGGLADTIFDIADPKISATKKNGYLFNDFDISSMNEALNRAIFDWFYNPDKFKKLVLKAMSQDFSWKKSAQAYQKTYEKLLSRKTLFNKDRLTYI